MNNKNTHAANIEGSFHLNNYIEIQKYLSKIYTQSRLNPLIALYLHTSLRSEMLQEKIKKQIGSQISFHYFNNVELLAQIKLSRDIPSIIVCQDNEYKWLDQFAKNDTEKVCGYTSYGKLQSMDLLFNFIESTYNEYKQKTYNVVSENAFHVKQSQKQKKISLNLYYNKENEEFYRFLIAKGNMNYLYDKINPYCYQSIKHLIELITASKSSEARIILAQSKHQNEIKSNIPKNKAYKLLLDNINNSLSYTQQVNEIVTMDPYQRLISSNYINFFISQEMEEQTQLAISNFGVSTNKIIIQKFKHINKQTDIESLHDRIQRLGMSQYSLVVIQQYQLKELQAMIIQNNYTNVLIIQHYIEELFKRQQTEALVLFNYSKINQLIRFLSQLKQNILLSSDPIFGIHVKKLNLYISRKQPLYNFLNEYQRKNVINIKIFNYDDHKQLKTLLLIKSQNSIVSLILCTEKELMNLYRYKVISAYDKIKVIIYPTEKNVSQFGGTAVAVACKKEDDVCNFLNGLTENLTNQQQQYPESIISPNEKIKMKSIKRYEVKKQHFILPDQGKSKVYLYMPTTLKRGESKIFKNRMLKILKNDITMEEYEKVEQILEIDYSLDPLCYIIIQEQNLSWTKKFAQRFSNATTLKLIIFSSLNPSNKDALNYPRIKLITTKFNQIEKYIVQDIKKYQKKYLTLLNKIYKQFIGDRNQENPTKIYCTYMKLMNIPQDSKLVKIYKFGTNEDIIKNIKAQNDSKFKGFIVVHEHQEKLILSETKNRSVYLLVIGGNIPDKQHQRIVYRSNNERDMQNFIKKIFLKQFESQQQELIRYSKESLSDNQRKKYLFCLPNHLLTNFLELPDFEYKGYNKFQEVNTLLQEMYEFTFILQNDHKELDKTTSQKFKGKFVYLSDQNQKPPCIRYKRIDDVKEYIQSLNEFKKDELIGKLSLQSIKKIVILFQNSLIIQKKNINIRYKQYENMKQLQSLIKNIQQNKIYKIEIVIVISFQNLANINNQLKNKYHFLIFIKSLPISLFNLPKNYTTFINTTSLNSFINQKLFNQITFKEKIVNIEVEQSYLIQKIQYRLEIRQSRPSTKVFLSLYLSLDQEPQNDYILIVNKNTYTTLKHKYPNNQFLHFIIFEENFSTNNDNSILFCSKNENEIISFVGNLEKTEKVPFLEFQNLNIFCDASLKSISSNLDTSMLTEFTNLKQLNQLLIKNQDSQPLVILKEEMQILLIMEPKQTFFKIIYSQQQFIQRPIFQLYDTLFVSNNSQNIIKYIHSLMGQQKIMLYPEAFQNLYRKQKHAIINYEKFKSSVYNSLGELNEQLKKYKKNNTCFIIICEEKGFNSTNVIVQDNKNKNKSNSYKIIVIIESGKERELAGISYMKKITFQKQYQSIFGLKKEKLDKKVIKSGEIPSYIDTNTENNTNSITSKAQTQSQKSIVTSNNPSINNKNNNNNTNNNNNNMTLETEKVKVNSKEYIPQSEISQRNNIHQQSSSKTFKKTASFGPKHSMQSHQIQSKIQSIKEQNNLPIDESSSRTYKESFYTEGIRSNPQNLIDSLKLDEISCDHAKSEEKSFNMHRKKIFSNQKFKIGMEKSVSNKIMNNSNQSQFIELVGIESFANKILPNQNNPSLTNQIQITSRKNKSSTLLIQAQKKELKSIIIEYQNNFSNPKILKYLNKEEFDMNIQEIISKKEDGIIVLIIDREHWIDSPIYQLHLNKLSFILIGKNQQKYKNRIYIKNYYTLLDEILGLNISNGSRLKRSTSNNNNMSSFGLHDSEKKNKQKILVIKKVKDNKNQSGHSYKNSEDFLKGIERELKNNNFITDEQKKQSQEEDNYGLLVQNSINSPKFAKQKNLMNNNNVKNL